METHKIRIGTSGWHYRHWLGTFYPADLKQTKQFSYYKDHFDTVELNNPFYKLPSPDTFSKWKEAATPDFIYSVKASRFITHMKKLKDAAESTALFFSHVNYLEEKLGPILFQLPPFFEKNTERLKNFLQHLPSGYRYTFEFRNASWYDAEIYDLLRERNCAFCIYELDRHMSPEEITSDLVYVRLHGPEGKYAGSYPEETLDKWALQCKKWALEGKQVFVYFDNDQHGYAAFNAKTLLQKISNS